MSLPSCWHLKYYTISISASTTFHEANFGNSPESLICRNDALTHHCTGLQSIVFNIWHPESFFPPGFDGSVLPITGCFKTFSVGLVGDASCGITMSKHGGSHFCRVPLQISCLFIPVPQKDYFTVFHHIHFSVEAVASFPPKTTCSCLKTMQCSLSDPAALLIFQLLWTCLASFCKETKLLP